MKYFKVFLSGQNVLQVCRVSGTFVIHSWVECFEDAAQSEHTIVKVLTVMAT